jgi:eukaryotic-like serine/threonine-protein kinase
MQILDAFEYLHGQTPNVIYRDLKPSNVIMMPNGRVKLIDFGIARLFKPEIRGTLIGTPGYASPEQYRGSAEPRTDLYALGALMHFMLTGRDPSNFEPFSFPLTGQMLPSLNPLLAALVDEALAEKIEDRVGSAGEFQRRLQASNAPAVTARISSAHEPSSVRAERQCPQSMKIS